MIAAQSALSRSRASRLRAAAVAATLWALLSCTYLFLVRTEIGQRGDSAVNSFLHNHIGSPIDGWLGEVARDVGPVLSLAVAVPLALFTAFRRRWRALAATALVAPAPAIAWLLRRNLPDRPDFGVSLPSNNTYPSTHAALVASACAAIVFLWPWRPSQTVLVVAAVVAGLGAFGNVLGFAHLPSDVLGSLLLVAGAMALAVAVSGWRRQVIVKSAHRADELTGAVGAAEYGVRDVEAQRGRSSNRGR